LRRPTVLLAAHASLLTVVGLTAAFVSGTARAAESNQILAVDEVDFIPCAVGGGGEPVHFTGNLLFRYGISQTRGRGSAQAGWSRSRAAALAHRWHRFPAASTTQGG
jgi:hypothetical protein